MVLFVTCHYIKSEVGVMELVEGTKIFNEEELKEAAQLLASGRLVAFPTETVYGLGGNALDTDAVKEIFKAKGRPADNPLIVHIARKKDINNLVKGEISKLAQRLIDKFWPGPLTLILPKAEEIPDITTGELKTVAVRMPSHPVALELIKDAQVPIAAPSANLSGRPSPTLAQHVIKDLAGRIAGIVDAGQTGIGIESTVLDLSQNIPTVLRPGGITYEELTEVIDGVRIDPAVKAKLERGSVKAISPGMKYKHYAPKADVILVEGKSTDVIYKIKQLMDLEDETKVGIMITSEASGYYKDEEVIIKVMGSRSNLKEVSSNIFKLLREFDQEGVNKIFVEGLPLTGLGLAIMNRLRKSAGYQIVEV